MGKNPESNALIREERQIQILKGALSVYIKCGYQGTDMDTVAKEAKVAKGLMYYYYKSKNELFAALYKWMFGIGMEFSDKILKESKDLPAVEQLAYYIYEIFGVNRENPQMVRFFLRVPFDSFAIFGPDRWKEGVRGSDTHRQALADIIQKGISEGTIQKTDAGKAANSLWTVFVANLFEYSRMIAGAEQTDMPAVIDVAGFCFRGLGIKEELWHECLEKVIKKKENI